MCKLDRICKVCIICTYLLKLPSLSKANEQSPRRWLFLALVVVASTAAAAAAAAATALARAVALTKQVTTDLIGS